MYLNFVNDKVIGNPQGLPNCYECISNFDCLAENDPEALKDLTKYGLPGHKWLRVVEINSPLRSEFYESHDPNLFSYYIVDDVVYFKYDVVSLDSKILLARIREDRNKILASTDWTQLPDVEISDEEKQKYAIYRKKLRALPNEYLKSGRLEWPVL